MPRGFLPEEGKKRRGKSPQLSPFPPTTKGKGEEKERYPAATNLQLNLKDGGRKHATSF